MISTILTYIYNTLGCHSTRPSSVVVLRECPEDIRAFPDFCTSGSVGFSRNLINSSNFFVRVALKLKCKER
jgi:hypothetical protein